ncbi:hypothetical protein DFH07DRAFT_776819 [Mycena maculata]|uniref:Uncharacterized protein n=1 Tax=Mycena maculata TaxID=230809 RepID=A0AAD7INA9_9AGAR|nr:hypothetical protein DFH07DRAFT_776819 [Mycena maculata]
MASAVAKLRTRIEDISLLIARQQEILRDLEKQKSAAQGELNAILDPMARLLLEIGDLHPLPPYRSSSPSPPRPHAIAHNIALSTPSLWTAIRIDAPFDKGFGKLMERWLTIGQGTVSEEDFDEDRLYPLPTLLSPDQWAKMFSVAPHFLQHITLPALESLTIPDCDLEFGPFFAFLSRSSPPLLLLCMVLPSGSKHYSEDMEVTVDKSLRLLPGLTQLDLAFDATWGEAFILSIVVALASQLLPNLTTLMIRGTPFWCVEYATGLGALSTRRASPHSKLRSFRFFCNSRRESRLVANITTGLRQLVSDGMEIHVGREGRNLI